MVQSVNTYRSVCRTPCGSAELPTGCGQKHRSLDVGVRPTRLAAATTPAQEAAAHKYSIYRCLPKTFFTLS
ncbi:hypothetical protein JOB18_014088 [Solea senegalensis]|uniref:Uncharacterized protein n=1 Tax=Solea senegalensis TaxID=28829 RepID=A0AAV6QNM3_SOLSE|nr:hypothetical protein JOB18_014088 [Solea senegalensis]